MWLLIGFGSFILGIIVPDKPQEYFYMLLGFLGLATASILDAIKHSSNR